jgi:hypothetical protein
MRDPCGKFSSRGAIAWRIWRDTRWRRTDPPTLFPIIRPARGESVDAGEMCRYPTKCSEVTRSPLLVVRAKSCGEVKRADAGSTSTKSGSALPKVLSEGAYAERRERPFARRAERTARPARVAMRARKPCFLARRREFGW